MKLKTVSFAVLGQLAFRPWAAYELIKEMRRNFHYFYPKAESGLYEELKKLEKYGLVSAQIKTKGKKERTVYTITTEGMRQLKQWLSSEPDHYSLEFEGLLRVFLSKFGERQALRNSLLKVQQDNDILLKLAEKVGNEYLNDEAPAQSEIAERVIIFDFLLHYSIMYKEWLARTETYLTRLDHIQNDLVPDEAKKIMKSIMNQFDLRFQPNSKKEHE